MVKRGASQGDDEVEGRDSGGPYLTRGSKTTGKTGNGDTRGGVERPVKL